MTVDPRTRWRQIPSPMTGATAWRRGALTAFVAQEWDGKRNAWHMSISHPRRYPTWDEIAAARYDLIPDAVTMAQLLPPRAEYVNVHERTFHLWEVEP